MYFQPVETRALSTRGQADVNLHRLTVLATRPSSTPADIVKTAPLIRFKGLGESLLCFETPRGLETAVWLLTCRRRVQREEGWWCRPLPPHVMRLVVEPRCSTTVDDDAISRVCVLTAEKNCCCLLVLCGLSLPNPKPYSRVGC